MPFCSIGHERLRLPDTMRAFIYQGRKHLTYYLKFHQGQKHIIQNFIRGF